MKATITREFNLPEEREEYEVFVKAESYHSIVHYLCNELRGFVKHGHPFNTIEETVDGIYDKLLDMMSEEGLHF